MEKNFFKIFFPLKKNPGKKMEKKIKFIHNKRHRKNIVVWGWGGFF